MPVQPRANNDPCKNEARIAFRLAKMSIGKSAQFYDAQVFSYQPLIEPDAIRLIVLYPATHDSDELHCSLIHTTLSQCEDDIFDHYTALSYVWGDGTDLRSISLDGTLFEVTSNLYSALTDLRHATKILRLWADAICINQTDEDEKSSQVAMMGNIYATAHHTVIYLGSLDTEAENFLRQVLTPAYSKSVSRVVRLEIADIILSKAWFRRVWVLQELVFSLDPRVQLGKYRWRWSYMYSFLKELSLGSDDAFGLRESDEVMSNLHVGFETGDSALQGYRLMSEMQLARDKHQGKVKEGDQATLFRLMVGRRGLGVTDPRDMIFAHIGFASDGYDRFVKPEYSKTCLEVYEDYARSVVDNYQSCGILFHVGDPKSPTRPPGLASWAPDWSNTKSTAAFVEIFQESGSVLLGDKGLGGFEAGKEFHYNYIWIKSQSVLACMGRDVDCITRFSIPLYKQEIPTEKRAYFTAKFNTVMENWMPWLSSPAAINGMYKNLRDRMVGEIVSLYCDIYNAWREVIKDERILSDWQTIIREPNFRMLFPPWQSDFCLELERDQKSNSSGLQQFLPNAQSKYNAHPTVIDCLVWSVFKGYEGLIKDRRLARTATGYLSLVPSYTEVADVIFCIDLLVAESNILCIIRPQQNPHAATMDETIRLKLGLARLSMAKKERGTFENRTSKDGEPGILHGTFIGDCFFDMYKGWPLDLMLEMEENPLLKRPMIYAIH
jgi:Heterokaryon incompatibility protein (HET)